MNYLEYFEDHKLSLDINFKGFDLTSSKIRYGFTYENVIELALDLAFKITIRKDNLDFWITEYPELKEVLADITDFEPLKDGKIIPYISVRLSQRVILYLNKERLDKVLAAEKDFELDTSVLNEIKFDEDHTIYFIDSVKKITKKKEKEILNALNLPIKDYNEIYDLTVLIN